MTKNPGFQSQEYAKDFAMSRIQSEREGPAAFGAGLERGAQNFVQAQQLQFQNALKQRQMQLEEAQQESFVASEALKREELSMRMAAMREKIGLGVQKQELRALVLANDEAELKAAESRRRAAGQFTPYEVLREANDINEEFHFEQVGGNYTFRPKTEEEKSKVRTEKEALKREEMQRKRDEDKVQTLIKLHESTYDDEEKKALSREIRTLLSGGNPNGPMATPAPEVTPEIQTQIQSRHKAVTHSSAEALISRLRIKDAEPSAMEFAKKTLEGMPGDEVQKRLAYFLRDKAEAMKDPARREIAIQEALLEIVRQQYEMVVKTRGRSRPPRNGTIQGFEVGGYAPRTDQGGGASR